MPIAPHPRHTAELVRILDSTEAYLEWKKDEGVTRLEAFGDEPARPPSVVPARAPAVVPQAARPPAKKKAATAPVSVAPADVPRELEKIAAAVAACTRCPLHKTRTNTVPGQGHPAPELMFIGEGPGADEDKQGLAFVGRAGQLLTRMIQGMGLTREDVFIANIVKCRPPENRVPTPEEMEACMPYLHQQIALLRPKVIVSLGATAAKGLLPGFGAISKERGKWRTFQGIDLMPTYHPAYLLRNESMKGFVWEDLKAVLRRLGRPVPKSK